MSLKITGGECSPYFSGYVKGFEVCNLQGTLQQNGEEQDVKITSSGVYAIEEDKEIRPKTENRIFNGGCEIDYSAAKILYKDPASKISMEIFKRSEAQVAAEAFFKMVAQRQQNNR
jgi:hypothetical protein